ncbi:MBOAT family O-acyltransferase [Marinilabilia rubra]|nr:MBOAT family O-acyltransferase [Marinilabilia rubra]
MASFSITFLVYAGVFTLVNYFVALYVEKEPGSRNRKFVYLAGQTFNIGGLVFFKYLNFIVENLFLLIGIEQANLGALGNIVLPLGISYYTFQSISYLYLVYKSIDPAEKRFLNVALYTVFFPKIIAGPIARHRSFFLQLKSLPWAFDYQRVMDGARLFMWGMFKKIIIGDTLGVIVTKVYGNIEAYQGMSLVIVFIIQPLQLYFDFSGYTDMALGLSRIFGIKLIDNFRRPFMAQTVSDFWRRWHISLSSWCNDFIYNRLLLKHRKWGKGAAIYAVFITFLVIGIWHGADWTFVILGVLQGIALTYEFLSKRRRTGWSKSVPPFLYKWGSRVFVYFFFSISLVFFFSQNLSDAVHFFRYMPQVSDILNTSYGFNIVHWELGMALILAILCLLIETIYEDEKIDLLNWFTNLRRGYKWSFYFMWLFLVVFFSKNQLIFVYAEF